MIVVYIVIGALASAYCIWGLVLFLLQPRLLFSPMRQVSFTPADIELGYEDVFFRTVDGLTLHGWYVPASEQGPTVIFCHGNAGNISHRLDSIKLFHEIGLNCFVFDYRGYGNSQGRPTEKGTYLDVEAAYRWLTEDKGLDSDRIIVFGRSLGGSIAAYLAATWPVCGLVVESAFTSYPDVGQRHYPYLPVRLFARYSYNTAGYLKRVTCPVMLIYSKGDQIIPFEFGRKLFELANEPKDFVEISGSHNDCFLASAGAYKEAWTRWLVSLDVPQGRPAAQQVV